MIEGLFVMALIMTPFILFFVVFMKATKNTWKKGKWN